MKIYNLNKKTTLATDLKEAKSPNDKLFGLLKKDNPRSLLFKTRFGIHTFFLKDKIDIIILNSKNVVVIAKTIKPNRIFVYNPKYLKIIELKKNTLKLSKTQIGDQLIIK